VRKKVNLIIDKGKSIKTLASEPPRKHRGMSWHTRLRKNNLTSVSHLITTTQRKAPGLFFTAHPREKTLEKLEKLGEGMACGNHLLSHLGEVVYSPHPSSYDHRGKRINLLHSAFDWPSVSLSVIL